MSSKLSIWKILAPAALLVASAGSASATTVGLIQASWGNAQNNIATAMSGGLVTPSSPDSYTVLSVDDFNAATPAALAASYDILVLPWIISGALNADWTTRILPFLNAGGGVLWEDPGNIDDLVASGISLISGNPYSSSVITLVPPFSDSGAVGFYHIHYGITGASSDWKVWSTDSLGEIHGVYGEFGTNGGRMVLGVSDNLYHPNFSSPTDADHYALTVNQLNWLATGSVTGTPVPEPASLLLLSAGLLASVAVRRRQQKKSD